MACDKKALVTDARNTTSPAVAGEHRPTKEVLLDALSYDCLASFACVVIKHKIVFVFITRLDYQSLALLFQQEGTKLFALDGQSFPVGMKFAPDLAISPGSAAQSFAPRRGNRWVKACEVNQLHSKRIGCAAYQASQLNNLWIPAVQLAERSLAVEVESKLELFARPTPFAWEPIGRNGDRIGHAGFPRNNLKS